MDGRNAERSPCHVESIENVCDCDGQWSPLVTPLCQGTKDTPVRTLTSRRDIRSHAETLRWYAAPRAIPLSSAVHTSACHVFERTRIDARHGIDGTGTCSSGGADARGLQGGS
mmetsp:Transcript_21393/g.46627  ORF Transcript_21393/g.46627 Transcript_21393/m.46627 type:complete len:113 (-) Transcript_21393:912-1250(-)